MSELKTKKQVGGVKKFLSAIPDPQTKLACHILYDLMRKVTGAEPDMWGTSIVGFGQYSYKYAGGRQGEWFKIGFSPRKQNITLYMMCGWDHPVMKDLLSNLGQHSLGKACLYIKRLDDINIDVLVEMLTEANRLLPDGES